MDRIGGRFTRHEPRRHAAELMLGLLAGDPDQKNCWSIAEHRGERSPDALQHLLSRAVWDADGMRDDSAHTWSITSAIRVPFWWSIPCRTWNYADHRVE